MMSLLVLGGLGKVMDDFQNLDNNLKGCGKRQLCEAMSLGSQIARSDGTFGFQKGFLRQGVDAALDALFEVAKPFMEVFGLGSVARQEVSFTRSRIVTNCLNHLTSLNSTRLFSDHFASNLVSNVLL